MPQPFFGGELRNAALWQNAGWGNPMLALAAQQSYPGSLAPPGPTPVPLPPLDESTKADIGQSADQTLQQVGRTAGIAGPIASRLGPVGRIVGPIIGAFGGILQNPVTRQPIAGFVGDSVANDIQTEINRINNAYGQHLFLNGGGMPHR
ncbi:MAG: hypothetical protein JO128_06425 [Alphaproteobacteria bacterium]|nr:hypothetical protein [Alphaproteobacteria bacterium]